MSSSSERAVSIQVTGLVQGVSYRAACAQAARSFGVSGWVRNESDGSVSVHAEGDPDAVEALVDWCHEGPPAAAVDDVEVRDVAATGARGFEVLR